MASSHFWVPRKGNWFSLQFVKLQNVFLAMGMEKRSVYHTNQIYLVDVILHVVVSEFLFIYKPNFIFNLVNIISEMVFYLCIY